jgi:hypothetical protein
MCFSRDVTGNQPRSACFSGGKKGADLKIQAVSMVSTNVRGKRISPWHGLRSDQFRDQVRGQIATIDHAF